MHMSDIEHTIIKATYCGKPNHSGLKEGCEYTFALNRTAFDGYWRARCLDNGILIIFSCINAMYDNFKNIELIRSDGTAIAF